MYSIWMYLLITFWQHHNGSLGPGETHIILVINTQRRQNITHYSLGIYCYELRHFEKYLHEMPGR